MIFRAGGLERPPAVFLQPVLRKMQGEIRAQGIFRKAEKLLTATISWKINSLSGESMPQHHHGQSVSDKSHSKLHKNWRMWMAVILMLSAIMIYVLTLDDSLMSLTVATLFC
jgi:hypothetical protein